MLKVLLLCVNYTQLFIFWSQA